MPVCSGGDTQSRHGVYSLMLTDPLRKMAEFMESGPGGLVIQSGWTQPSQNKKDATHEGRQVIN